MSNQILTADITVYSGAAETTRYLASENFPATAQPYTGKLFAETIFERRLEQPFGGRAYASVGALLIDNSDGVYDSWLTDTFDGRTLTLKVGDSTDYAMSSFSTLLVGESDRIEVPDLKSLRLVTRDRMNKLNAPVQTALIGGSGPNKDRPKPLCFGEVYNVTPALINDTTHEYQVHDGQIEDIVTVYENGVATALTVTEDLTNGKFTLSAKPSGQLTCDVKGAKPSGTYLTKSGEIIKHIIINQGGIAAGDVNTSSITTLDTDAPYTIGVFVPDRRNTIDVLDEIITSVGGYYGFTRAGVFFVGRLVAPTGTAVTDIGDHDIVGEPQVTFDQTPLKQVRLFYKRNWTVITAGVATTIAEAQRAYLLEKGLIYATTEDAAIVAAHPRAQAPDAVLTLIAGLADATTEAARRATLFGTQRFKYKVQVHSDETTALNLGDIVTLTDERYGLSAGKKCLVIGIREYVLDSRAELELWA